MQKFLTPGRDARILANMKPLNEVLREWRETLKLTPAEAARRCRISPQQWSELEGGATKDPRSSTIQKLAEGTGIDSKRLVAAATYVSPDPVPA